MEVLNSKREIFFRAYSTLDGFIKKFELEHDKLDTVSYQMSLCAVIKQFELTYETCWKFLKEFLRMKHEVEALSPRAVFQACYKQNILTQEIVENLVALADDRNQTVHVYDQVAAQDVVNDINKHYSAFSAVINQIKL